MLSLTSTSVAQLPIDLCCAGSVAHLPTDLCCGVVQLPIDLCCGGSGIVDFGHFLSDDPGVFKRIYILQYHSSTSSSVDIGGNVHTQTVARI